MMGSNARICGAIFRKDSERMRRTRGAKV
uniref:Uncharacterized protein n=1 Tax=Rhizophora mucronata TaxID=61149 RepID=A0A2P2N1C1_RHIMU